MAVVTIGMTVMRNQNGNCFVAHQMKMKKATLGTNATERETILSSSKGEAS